MKPFQLYPKSLAHLACKSPWKITKDTTDTKACTTQGRSQRPQRTRRGTRRLKSQRTQRTQRRKGKGKGEEEGQGALPLGPRQGEAPPAPAARLRRANARQAGDGLGWAERRTGRGALSVPLGRCPDRRPAGALAVLPFVLFVSFVISIPVSLCVSSVFSVIFLGYAKRRGPGVGPRLLAWGGGHCAAGAYSAVAVRRMTPSSAWAALERSA